MKKALLSIITLLSLILITVPNNLFAHVAYVIDDVRISKNLGSDFAYLFKPFAELETWLYVLGTIVVVLILWNIAHTYGPIKKNLAYAKERLESYHELIPWILRLSLGIALIGAGSEQFLISPVIDDGAAFATVQIVLGFLYLLGFLLVPVTIITIGLYILALSTDFYLIGNIDTLALALGFLVFHSARPGLDDMLGFSLLSRIRIHRDWLAPMVRAGIGVSMIFLAFYEKILNPHIAELVVTDYSMTNIVPVSEALWVSGTGIVELVVGVLLLVGLFTRTTSCVAFLVLVGSFFFFKESVTSHVTLFGILTIVTIEGGGKWSIDRWWKGRKAQVITQTGESGQNNSDMLKI